VLYFYARNFASTASYQERQIPKRFTYSSSQEWDERKINETIEKLRERRYTVDKIELMKKEGPKPIIINISLPNPKPLI
jgi:hypothetical protein